ncbi:hypothetical protein F5148DRAFT_1158736 [Russula earlei]|uniref:Uncharacterized protein n=1 Tax=Russula earlei TaxID=71964 RepID=A0ACC0UPS6_9AGAM|nr:hypothetical protein F5148DRAFT_1158736 [Russula earlei]
MLPALSAILFFPLVSALTFTTPSNVTSGGSTTISWTPDAGDPQVFSLELLNTVFHNSFAIANNVQTATGQITVNLPIVPTGVRQFVAPLHDINAVVGTSGAFPIAPTATTSSVASSTTSSPASAASPAISTAAITSTSSSGSTSSGSSSGSSPSATPSSFNGNGASGRYVDSGHVGSMVAAVVGIVAGGIFV